MFSNQEPSKQNMKTILIGLSVIAILAVCISGCSSASSDLNAKLPDGTSFGRAVFQASTGGTCVNTWVGFSKKDASGKFKSVKTAVINHGLIGHTSIGHVDLPPGRYHVGGATCVTQGHSHIQYTGKTAGSVGLFKSPEVLDTLGTIEIKAGEVVNIGFLSFIRVYPDRRRFDSVMIVEANSQKHLDALRSSNSSLASKLVTRHAQSSATSDQLAATEARLSGLKPHGINKHVVDLQLNMVRRARAKM